MTRARTVDVHAHVLTEKMMDRMRRESPAHGPRLEPLTDEHGVLVVSDTRYAPFPRGAWDLERRVRDMGRTRVDLQVLSVVPQAYGYELEPKAGAALARIQNEEIAVLVREAPDRFAGLATLPMQDPEAAAAELRYAMTSLGLRGAAICTNVRQRNLDATDLEPVWQAAQALGAFVLVHPQRAAAAERLSSYYLVNLLGNPIETSIAIASLVFGGVVERHPGVTFCFAHGGGFVPYQRGRLEHGWRVRGEPRRRLTGPPAASLDLLHFDTILHSREALAFLVGAAGVDRVLMGSDYPFDMGPTDPVAEVEALGLAAPACEAVCGATAARLLRLGRD